MPRVPRLRLTVPPPLEHAMQATVCRLLAIEVCAPGKLSPQGVTWWAIDAADFGGSVPGTRIGRGLVAGCPDLFLLFRGRSYFIELKRPGTGVMSGPQQWLLPVLAAAGSCIGVARDEREVLALLDEWKIPRAHRTTLAA